MPSFTTASPNLQGAGPLVQLLVAVPQAVADAFTGLGQPVPAPLTVTAMVDTGASQSVIQAGLASQLGLHPVGVVTISTPSSTNVQCPTFLVRLVFPTNVIADGLTVIEAPLQGQNIQMLIGRDLLARAVLIYIGYANQFTISF